MKHGLGLGLWRCCDDASRVVLSRGLFPHVGRRLEMAFLKRESNALCTV